MAEDTATQVPAAEATGPKPMSATILDMVRSLGVLVIVVAVTLIFVPGLFHPSKSQRFQPVSFADDAQGFKQVTGRSALVPTGLPKPWYSNSASLKYSGAHAHLHIGWVTPGNDYAAIEESNQPPAVFIPAVIGTKGAQVTGSEQIGGVTWSRSTSTTGEPSITRTANGITTVITGSASAAQQEQLAASLATAS